MRLLRIDIGVAAVVVALWVPTAARAACAVSISAVAFGHYDPASSTPKSGVGTMRVVCDETAGAVGYRLALSVGGGTGYATRRMSDGEATIAYQLYKDIEHTMIWGDGTGGSDLVYANSIPKEGGTQVFFIYGLIPALLKASPGAYADTVVVTIEY
jgi:spore coat protein U-like protein